MEIQKADLHDAWDIATIQVKTWQEAYVNIICDEYLENMSITKRFKYLQKDFLEEHTQHLYVIKEAKKTVGFCAFDTLSEDEGELSALYFLPEYWGQGYSKFAMTYVCQILCKQGCTKLSLWVLEANARARRFYEKCGFVYDGMNKIVQLGTPVTQLHYSKLLRD